jgi:hypothetical protein
LKDDLFFLFLHRFSVKVNRYAEIRAPVVLAACQRDGEIMNWLGLLGLVMPVLLIVAGVRFNMYLHAKGALKPVEHTRELIALSQEVVAEEEYYDMLGSEGSMAKVYVRRITVLLFALLIVIVLLFVLGLALLM